MRSYKILTRTFAPLSKIEHRRMVRSLTPRIGKEKRTLCMRKLKLANTFLLSTWHTCENGPAYHPLTLEFPTFAPMKDCDDIYISHNIRLGLYTDPHGFGSDIALPFYMRSFFPFYLLSHSALLILPWHRLSFLPIYLCVLRKLSYI